MVYVIPAKELETRFMTLKNTVTVAETESSRAKKEIIRSFTNYTLVGCLVIIYCSMGAWVFQHLEDDDDRHKTRQLRYVLDQARQTFTTSALSLMNRSCPCCCEAAELQNSAGLETFGSLLHDYESELNDISDGELTLYLSETENPVGRWNFFHSLLFVFTLVTTIGYGNLTPKTLSGRVFCILFSLLGIPLMLIEIHLAGKLLAKVFISSALGKFFSLHDLTPTSEKSTRLQKLLATTFSVLAVLTLLLFYNMLGGFLYNATEKWGYINSFYFCFTTLTTVGFGDLVPQSGGNPFAFFRLIYILFGLALTSTSFELVRTQYAKSWSTPVPALIAKHPAQQAFFVAVQRLEKPNREAASTNAFLKAELSEPPTTAARIRQDSLWDGQNDNRNTLPKNNYVQQKFPYNS